ncbi:DUF4870 domain-containing protein [Cytophagaceae bacterium ABcell3]|nr:DUF4870 domain-containing protein [Cytophagaceae bacterium ABcell3]
MISVKEFVYTPSDHESERASNSYVMSLVALIAGLPLPIVNLIATFIFFMGNRKATYFVRWHCIQALLSQVSLLVFNTSLVWWTIAIVFGDQIADNQYFSWLFTVLLFNIVEFIFTIYTAVKTRNGIHVEWFFYGSLTNLICKPAHEESTV